MAQESSEPSARRTALVTGGSDGIGRAVALRLAARGFTVWIVGRNRDRATAVVEQLHAVSGAGGAHRHVLADLTLLQDTARLAEQVTTSVSRLDAVVCCAGQFTYRPAWTGEGLERGFVLNYLSRYLLVRRLRPALHAAPSARVVLVSNAGNYSDTLDFDDLQYRRGRPGLRVAGRSQVANDLFAVELAARTAHTALQVTCVYPGIVDTGLFRHADGLPRWAEFVLPRVAEVAGIPVDEAADTPAWLAADPAAIGVSGRFFGPHRRQRQVPARMRRTDRRRQLWEASQVLVDPYLGASTDADRAPHQQLR